MLDLSRIQNSLAKPSAKVLAVRSALAPKTVQPLKTPDKPFKPQEKLSVRQRLSQHLQAQNKEPTPRTDVLAKFHTDYLAAFPEDFILPDVKRVFSEMEAVFSRLDKAGELPY